MPVLPELPRRPKGTGPWSPRTKRLYAGWRADPVTGTYGENEIAATIELAFLQEEVSRGKTSLATEVRQRGDGLGLTLKGKRDLRFHIEKPEPESKPRQAKRISPDRRARLSIVK